MQTPIDFGKDFLYRLYDQRDADACQKMLAGDLVWITPEEMHHFLSEGAVLKHLRKQIKADAEARYVDLISIKSSPSADNIMTVAYEINLVSREEEKPLYLRCSMVICRRSRRLEITFLHFSTKSERDSSEQLRDFVTNLPCGVMILACLDGRREEAIFYNEYFAHRLRYRQEEFARAMAQNPFFMATEEDRDRIHEEIGQARRNGGNIAANLRFYRRDGNSFYYRMLGAPAYQADGGTVYYCVFQETTGFRLTTDRLQNRLDTATGILRQIPEAFCGIEYPPQETSEGDGRRMDAGAEEAADAAGRKADVPASNASAALLLQGTVPVTRAVPEPDDGASDGDVKIYRSKRDRKSSSARPSHSRNVPKGPRVFFTSKNIPALFGVSNSTFMKNILQDPLYGLEITSITRDRLLATRIFDPAQSGSSGPVSCGIFRLRKKDAPVQENAGSVRMLQAGPKEDCRGRDSETRETREEENLSAGKDPSVAAVTAETPFKKEGKEERAFAAEPPRVELVVRRTREKDGTVRIYLFYYDREAQQQDMEKRIDRAMKMGRAGQDQLRADLRKAKDAAARRQSELHAAMQQAQEKSAADIARAENQLVEEKNRVALLSRQLEESRAAQKRMTEEMDRVREDADRTVRSIRARADRKIREAEEKAKETEKNIVRISEEKAGTIEQQAREAQQQAERRIAEMQQQADEVRRAADQRIAEAEQRIAQTKQRIADTEKESEQKAAEAVTARALLEEQLREAQERNRLLEEQLRNERARRNLSEEQLQSERARRNLSEEQTAGSSIFVNPGKMVKGGNPLPLSPVRSGDWMTAGAPLTVFSSMDPVIPSAAQPAPALGAASAPAAMASAAADPTARTGTLTSAAAPAPSAELSAEAADPPAETENSTLERSLELTQERSPDPAGNRQAPGYQIPCTRENIRDIMDDFLEASSTGRELLREKPFSPETCLQNVLVYEGMACEEKGILLRLYRDSRLPATVTGFGALLQRALCEILENAIAHTPRGGTISIHCRADRPSAGLVNLYFRIDDNGSGISASRMQTIFESESGEGSGQPERSGLFAAREAATLMGGSIHARSGRDGTRFSLHVTLHV